MPFVAVLLAARSLGLAQRPTAGVACPNRPNVTTCGRVGIGVWLKRPARSVEVSIDGMSLRLHAGGFGGTGPTYWEGYARLDLRRLGIPPVWIGARPTVFLMLHLVVRYPGRTASGRVRVQLRAGWG
jgi:hypothetical protein